MLENKIERGFTLIELLAVIVILAIIALIATPIVLDIIEDSKESSTKRSAELYLDGVEQAIARYQLNGKEVTSGTYYVMENGNICTSELSDNKCTGEEIIVTVDGTKPNGGSIKIEQGEVKKESSFMFIENNITTYDQTNKTFIVEMLEVICTKTDGVDLNSLHYGDEFTCNVGDEQDKTFYVLEISGNNISLIIDRNIDNEGKGTTEDCVVEWISNKDYQDAGGIYDITNDSGACQLGGYCSKNEFGPVTANNYLKNSTINWNKLNSAQISLPTYNQIYIASGNKTSLPIWLYKNLSEYTGYWTSTPDLSSFHTSFYVYYAGVLETNITAGKAAIRPVITISKSQLG